MARSQTHSGARSATVHTPAGNARKATVWRFSVRRRLSKIKDKKESGQGRAPRVHLALLLIVFDKGRGETDGTELVQRPVVKLWDSLAKPERYGYVMG